MQSDESGETGEADCTNVKDEVRSEGQEELVVPRGGHCRNFVSGDLSELNGILPN